MNYSANPSTVFIIEGNSRFQPPMLEGRGPPVEALLSQQIRVLFMDVENMLELFTGVSARDHPAKLERLLRRVNMYLARLETLLWQVLLPADKLARAREYRAQLQDMIWAIENLLNPSEVSKSDETGSSDT